MIAIMFFFFKQKTAYELRTCLEFRRVLFRSCDATRPLRIEWSHAVVRSIDEVPRIEMEEPGAPRVELARASRHDREGELLGQVDDRKPRRHVFAERARGRPVEGVEGNEIRAARLAHSVDRD